MRKRGSCSSKWQFSLYVVFYFAALFSLIPPRERPRIRRLQTAPYTQGHCLPRKVILINLPIGLIVRFKLRGGEIYVYVCAKKSPSSHKGEGQYDLYITATNELLRAIFAYWAETRLIPRLGSYVDVFNPIGLFDYLIPPWIDFIHKIKIAFKALF